MSARRSFPRSISASLMVVYSASTDVAPKGRQRKRKDSFTTIEMHVDTICALSWAQWYAASRSVFTTRMRFEGHLMRMDAIMWIILRRQNQYKHVWRVSFSTRLFTDSPGGPGK